MILSISHRLDSDIQYAALQNSASKGGPGIPVKRGIIVRWTYFSSFDIRKFNFKFFQKLTEMWVAKNVSYPIRYICAYGQNTGQWFVISKVSGRGARLCE